MDQLAVATMSGEPTADGAARDAFDAWRDDVFAHYYADRPVNATFIGFHGHDRALPDFSPAGLERRNRAMRNLRAQLAAIRLDGLDTPRRHDALLLDGYLELQLLEDGLAQFHRGNPALYTGEGVFAVLSLFLRDAEPLADRVEAAIARMRALPAFLDQARENVERAPTAWTEQAMRESAAAAAYFGDGVPRLAAERGISDRRFQAAAETARDAFVEHRAWLDETLRARPTPDVACGREAFDRYLARGHVLPDGHDASWLERHALHRLDEEQAALRVRAAAIDPSRTWQELLADLENDHPSPEGYLAAFSRVWTAAKDAAVAADLVTWPEFPIAYVPVPASDREAAAGLYYLPYRCPAPLGRPETHRYLVPSLDRDAPEAEQTRRLRATNDAVITLNHVIHHGGLGHHVQNWYAFRSESRVGRVAGVDCASRIAMFCAGTLVEGWACYATDLMDEIGFLSPLQSLANAQGRVRMAARAVADVALHTGAMSLAETADFYQREAGMAEPAARGEAVKNSMFPGAAMMYLVGTDAIHDLRRRMAEREGSGFSLRAFHDRVLGYGAIPVSLIAADMLGPG